MLSNLPTLADVVKGLVVSAEMNVNLVFLVGAGESAKLVQEWQVFLWVLKNGSMGYGGMRNGDIKRMKHGSPP